MVSTEDEVRPAEIGEGPGVPVPRPADIAGLELRRSLVASRLFGDRRGVDRPRVGRYIVRRHLGAGAMGVVYEAWDDSLDRRVAIKLLHGATEEGRTQTGARLRREAKAMARLSHSRVATIYEVGEHEGETFIAMEYVEGPTLRRWLTRSRLAAQTLRVLLEAGEGLAAAHEASLVHRDFKPENVLVGSDGAKVVDLGVASSGRPATTPSTAVDLGEPSWTHSGELAGTPAYMAPEQLRGEAASPESDQYAFCVTLYEALFGRRPFEADTLEALLEAMAGELPPPRRSPSDLRPHVLAVLRRGLQADPARRYESMPALLLALRLDPAARRRRLGLAGIAATAVGLTGFAAARMMETPACEGPRETMAAAWSGERQAEIGSAFAATGLPYAADTWERARARLDEWAGAWATMGVEACRAHVVHHTQTSSVHELRDACLQRRLHRFEGLVDTLAEIDAPGVGQAMSAVASLPEVEGCADVERLRARLPPPEDPAVAEQVEAIEQRLDRLEARSAVAGELSPEELAEADAALEDARATEHGISIARALEVRARILGHNERREAEAEAMMREAMSESLSVGDDELFVSVTERLARWSSLFRDDASEGLRVLELADAASRRLGSPVHLRRRVLEARGRLLTDVGRFDEAEAVLRESLALLDQIDAPFEEQLSARMGVARLGFRRGELDAGLRLLDELAEEVEDKLGESHPLRLRVHLATSSTLLRIGDPTRAEQEAAIAVAGFGALYGEQGADYASALASLAGARLLLGRKLDQVEADYLEALEVLRAQRGVATSEEDHILAGLGMLYQSTGRLDEAVRHMEESLEVARTRRGEDHVSVASTLVGLGSLERMRGRPDEALARIREALEVYRRAGADNHPGAGMAHLDEGTLLGASGEVEKALRSFERAESVLLTLRGGQRSSHTGLVARERARVLLAAGRVAEARRDLELALSDAEADHKPESLVKAGASFELARLIVEEDRERARSLAQAALADFERYEPQQAERVRAWLDAHP